MPRERRVAPRPAEIDEPEEKTVVAPLPAQLLQQLDQRQDEQLEDRTLAEFLQLNEENEADEDSLV